MGGAKAAWLESEERGWDAPEKNVCADCVEDPFLKSVIESTVCSDNCDYCDASADSDIAAPVEEIMPSIMGALTHYFAEPGGAGVPYESAEGGFLIQGTDTQDALLSLPLECNDKLLLDVAAAIHNDYWVDAAEGHWASEQQNELLKSGWERFANHVKHRQRYFFSAGQDSYGQDIEPAHLLPELGKVVSAMDLIEALSEGTTVFRARPRGADETWPLDETNLGAAPAIKVMAGRMNPAGIPYLYVSLDQETPLAEVLQAPPSAVAMGRFVTTRNLRILNLIDVASVPSMFDVNNLRVREFTIFLHHFVEAIARPVSKDGAEHIEYVPSQVVSEYFATVHDRDRPLDGMLYPSAVRKGGRNLVLFPATDPALPRFSQLRFVDAELIGVRR